MSKSSKHVSYSKIRSVRATTVIPHKEDSQEDRQITDKAEPNSQVASQDASQERQDSNFVYRHTRRSPKNSTPAEYDTAMGEAVAKYHAGEIRAAAKRAQTPERQAKNNNAVADYNLREEQESKKQKTSATTNSSATSAGYEPAAAASSSPHSSIAWTTGTRTYQDILRDRAQARKQQHAEPAAAAASSSSHTSIAWTTTGSYQDQLRDEMKQQPEAAAAASSTPSTSHAKKEKERGQKRKDTGSQQSM